MQAANFTPNSYTFSLDSGSVSWQSPSNIALIKYWGKYGAQLPKNSSLSFTLSNCFTETSLSFHKKEIASENFDFEVVLDGKVAESFKPKIETFFNRIETYIPFLKNYRFTIETSNTFPHSSGIASSASGMSALAMCLVDMESKMKGESIGDNELKKASFLARLGSGSACRSIEGPIVVWGEHKEIKGSTNLFGTIFPYEIHDNFKNYQDTILLVDKGEKQVSSTVGHNLMIDHPFAEQRFKQAETNLIKLLPILEQGLMDDFIAVVESEALSLHAMMMTSMPYFILMKPNTLEIINKIWNFRKETNSKVCFTLDAGANVHVLYPEAEKKSVLEFINNELVAYCQNGQYICDQIGFGAKKV